MAALFASCAAWMAAAFWTASSRPAEPLKTSRRPMATSRDRSGETSKPLTHALLEFDLHAQRLHLDGDRLPALELFRRDDRDVARHVGRDRRRGLLGERHLAALAT